MPEENGRRRGTGSPEPSMQQVRIAHAIAASRSAPTRWQHPDANSRDGGGRMPSHQMFLIGRLGFGGATVRFMSSR